MRQNYFVGIVITPKNPLMGGQIITQFSLGSPICTVNLKHEFKLNRFIPGCTGILALPMNE